MSDSNKLEKKPESSPEEDTGAKRSRTSWVLGWVVAPLSVVGLIFGAGVLVGVHLHESWFARLVVWFVDLF
jgi:uncharacterized membrane protein YfcA